MARHDEDLSRLGPPSQPSSARTTDRVAITQGHEEPPAPLWSWLGVSGLVVVGLVIAGALGLHYGGGGRGYRLAMGLSLGLGLVGGVTTVGLAAIATRRAGLGFLESLSSVSRVWVRPSGDWAVFGFGVLASLPLVVFFTRVLIGDSDSARLVASIEYVQHQDWHYLIHTQENYLPHLVMGPILALGGIPAVKVLTILTVQALAGVVSFITWKVTHNTLAALASVLALLTFNGIVERTAYLPMYPAMLALGYTGTYLAYRAIVSDGGRRMTLASLAGLCLALSPEAQPVGQIFFLFPALLLVGTGLRRGLPALLRVYVALGVFFVPRAIINVSEGGLSHFLSYRVDFWITKGYLNYVQQRFFHYPSRLGYVDYFIQLSRHATRITGRLGLVVVAMAMVGLLLARGKVQWLVAIAGAYLAVPFLLARAPFFPRYFSPFLVGVALAVGLLIARLSRRPWSMARVVVPGLVAMLFLFALVDMAGTLRDIQRRQAAVLNGPLRELASRITDGKGVIGARSLDLLFVDPRLRTYGSQFLSEREYVTYLTWPSDDAVIQILRAHDIGWVLIRTNRWETRYNDAWLVPVYGKPARQLFAVAASPKFCLEFEALGFHLYKLGCPPSEQPG